MGNPAAVSTTSTLGSEGDSPREASAGAAGGGLSRSQSHGRATLTSAWTHTHTQHFYIPHLHSRFFRRDSFSQKEMLFT